VLCCLLTDIVCYFISIITGMILYFPLIVTCIFVLFVWYVSGLWPYIANKLIDWLNSWMQSPNKPHASPRNHPPGIGTEWCRPLLMHAVCSERIPFVPCLGVMGVLSAFCPWWLWPWHSNSSERGTSHVAFMTLAQIHSAVPGIFEWQTKQT